MSNKNKSLGGVAKDVFVRGNVRNSVFYLVVVLIILSLHFQVKLRKWAHYCIWVSFILSFYSIGLGALGKVVAQYYSVHWSVFLDVILLTWLVIPLSSVYVLEMYPTTAYKNLPL